MEPVGINSGSNSGLRPERLTRSSTYSGLLPMWLSVSHDAVIDTGVAAARPVSRKAR